MKLEAKLKEARRAVLGVALMSLTALGGCRPAEIETPGDHMAARGTLVQVLDAWKAGKNAEDLRAADPPIYATDSDWRAGTKLSDYRISGAPIPNGGEWRVYATLTLAGKDGAKRSQRVCFAVAPGSPANVMRSDVAD